MASRNFSPALKEKSTEDGMNTACAPDDVTGKVQELASAVVLKTEDVASGVSHKAQAWAGNVADKAQDTASAVVHKTDDAIAAVGHQMNALGGKLRDAAPHDGAVGAAAGVVADELHAGGQYLEGHGLEAIGGVARPERNTGTWYGGPVEKISLPPHILPYGSRITVVP